MSADGQLRSFKAAFISQANEKFWGPRWTEASYWFQTKTSLTTVVAALDTLIETTNAGNLLAVHQAIDGLKEKKKSRYKAALDALRENLAKVIVDETPIDDDVSLGRLSDGKGQSANTAAVYELVPTRQTDQGRNPSGADLLLTYNGGDICDPASGSTRSVSIQMVCDLTMQVQQTR